MPAPDALARARTATRTTVGTVHERMVELRARTQSRRLRGPAQGRLVEELRAEIRALAAAGDESAVQSPWWRDVRRQLIDHVAHGDPRCFLSWPEIRHTMFVMPSADFVEPEIAELSAADDWASRWRPVLEEDPVGCPIRLPARRWTSANLVHHAYHVLTLERHAVQLADLDEIVEFGGGYGSFVRLVRRLGFRGRYHVHDFPELGAVQRYYLRSVAALHDDSALAENTTFGHRLSDVPPASPEQTRLFVALWSLSETPASERQPWVDQIAAASHVLIAFQHEFEEVDNRAWFDDLSRSVDLSWRCWEIPHLPGSSYLLGTPTPSG